jgi:hypothetical protein
VMTGKLLPRHFGDVADHGLRFAHVSTPLPSE